MTHELKIKDKWKIKLNTLKQWFWVPPISWGPLGPGTRHLRKCDLRAGRPVSSQSPFSRKRSLFPLSKCPWACTWTAHLRCLKEILCIHCTGLDQLGFKSRGWDCRQGKSCSGCFFSLFVFWRARLFTTDWPEHPHMTLHTISDCRTLCYN